MRGIYVIGIGLLVAALLPAVAQADGFDPVAATDAYLATLPAADRARSDAYFEGGYWLILWNALYTIAVMAVLLWSGLSARLRDLARRIARRRWLEPLVYGPLFVLVSGLLTLPIDWYKGFRREHEYGLSNQDLSSWGQDHLTQTLVGAVGLALLLTAIYAVIRRAPKRWWLWAGGIAALFLGLQVAVGPVFLAPLFNHYTPLAPSPVRDAILAMARSDGVPATEIYQFDASRQSKRISANVSGLFGTTQISLNDNLLGRSDPDEIVAVMGHEMGHYVMNHVVILLLYLTLLLLLGAAWCQGAAGWAIARWGRRWRVDSVADPAGLPVLVAALTVYFFVMTPVLNTIIRQQEMQADLFGLNLARRPDAFARVALLLSEYRKLDPSPLEEWIFFDHPSGRTRILTAMRWKAAQLQSPPPALAP
jgi:STE24 endopeptidase